MASCRGTYPEEPRSDFERVVPISGSSRGSTWVGRLPVRLDDFSQRRVEQCSVVEIETPSSGD